MIDLLKCRKLCLFLFVLLISSLIIPQFALAYGYDEKDYDYCRHTTLEPGEYKTYNAAGYYGWYITKGNSVKAKITVLSGDEIDVYLLDEDQYEDYLEDANNTNASKAFTFIENGSKQNTKQFSYTYKVEYDGNYYIVIDNRNNYQPDDALPTGNVSVEIKYSEIWAGYNGFYPEIPVEAVLICATTFIILIIIIIAVVIMLTKKGKKNIPPPPMPANYYPPQP